MLRLTSFAPVPIGACCCNDDYGARRSYSAEIAFSSSFYTVYRQMQSLPSNARSSVVCTNVDVMGGLAHVA